MKNSLYPFFINFLNLWFLIAYYCDCLQYVTYLTPQEEADGSNEYNNFQPGSLNTTKQLIQDLKENCERRSQQLKEKENVIQDLKQACEQKEVVIQQLKQACDRREAIIHQFHQPPQTEALSLQSEKSAEQDS